MIDRRRTAAPPAELPPAAKRCRNIACNNVRPYRVPFCAACWDKLPRDFRKSIAANQAKLERAALVQYAAEFLTFRAEDDLPFCWICGCTEEEGCDPPCTWASDERHPDRDVCSNCVEASAKEL